MPFIASIPEDAKVPHVLKQFDTGVPTEVDSHAHPDDPGRRRFRVYCWME
jgi:hypothetical protein